MKTIGKIILGFLSVILLALLLVVGGFIYKTHQQFQEVKKYQPLVERELKNADIPEYKDIALAIIFTETKGQTSDLMQSSESVHGTTNGMESADESVKAGIDFLAKSIQRAKEKNVDVWTAVQAYNFGLPYIDFIASHGGKNTIELAKQYSKDVVAPSLGNTTGHEYNYNHPLAIFQNGGKLYTDGGNYFYASIVQLNEGLYQWLA